MLSSTLSTIEEEVLNDCYKLMLEKAPDMASRFGIWRVHEHFEKQEDEVFYETSNSATQESTLRIVKRSALPETAFPSTWQLTEKGPIAATWCCDDAPITRPKP